ncbi:MAG: hypothetical protein K2G30_01175, partial [Muribaculaceae bacterium]|nr:hypothetical protein [Muribaculaceae bacterium]
MRKTILSVSLFALSAVASAQVYKDAAADVEARVEDLLGRMTLEEKIDYIGGYNVIYIRAIESLGVPDIKLT